MSETTMDRDLNLSNFRIKNVGTAVDPDDAVSKAYLETTRPSMFDTIETIVAGDPSPDGETLIKLAHPTNIYNALVFLEGAIQKPSATNPDTGHYEVREYQIISMDSYSLLQFHAPVPNGSNVLVFYNKVIS